MILFIPSSSVSPVSGQSPACSCVTRIFSPSSPVPPPSFSLPAASFNNAWGAETGESEWDRHAKTVEERESNKKGRKGGRREQRHLNTTVMYECKMVWWKTVKRGRRGRIKGEDRVELGFMVCFFSSSLFYIILKSISFCEELSRRSTLRRRRKRGERESWV